LDYTKSEIAKFGFPKKSNLFFVQLFGQNGFSESIANPIFAKKSANESLIDKWIFKFEPHEKFEKKLRLEKCLFEDFSFCRVLA